MDDRIANRNRRRAAAILLVFGSILVLLAAWDLPDNSLKGETNHG